ncbi:MAG: hypothetical protein GTO45_02100 [Candidatus Aminicenantes bacterium]|nr:hypothetical protein [Candidatus Aminicenantes bacterium]NIN40725.1 hypothetical protein [Candidatus Aminicenantes bacterium]NIN83534.1 hypothetical protein [Candidatus Aminicenantes bacterium]NIO79421.1 hypothetical protein [Candidatus Aminicenantes bacterium]NIQ65373.1 hypothetical protein [Candidatus Aminicenantes bacterium]
MGYKDICGWIYTYRAAWTAHHQLMEYQEFTWKLEGVVLMTFSRANGSSCFLHIVYLYRKIVK